MTETEIVERVQCLVCQRMAGQQAGHDVDHVLRVLKSAREIQAEVGGDRFVVELAALLHDLGDAKFHDGQERSAEFARDILSKHSVDPSTIEHVATIVDTISFRKAADPATLSLEAKIVQDADRLDALGAIGIVRTIEYGAAIGQPFYLSDNPGGKHKTAIDHFDEKLFKLHDLLNTDAARRIAGQREQFMRTFLDQFRHECGETE
ncbi:HD domain-containing protein [Novipirellula caenicola]|uniref:Uncharacterized protein YedJ n=1 Tax=Novipirellula caenicola TaxID=1536901 RepID=A0ABP9VRB2_9BACT